MALLYWQAINTISAIARCVNSEALIAFYPSLVAGLNNIVSSPNTVTQDLALKGAALQALASIGETVGRDKFAADGIAAMDLTAKVCEDPNAVTLPCWPNYGVVCVRVCCAVASGRVVATRGLIRP